MPRSLFLIALFCLFSLASYGQPEDIGSGSINNQPQTEIDQPPFNPEVSPTKSTQEVYLSIGVLVFGLAVVFAQVFLLNRRQEDENLSDSFKYLSITLIIVGALFMVTAGYGNDQIAPIIGLLGTVAGYLLGRTGNGGAPAKR